MYARTVRIQLKPNSVAAFTQTLENTIIPLLRTQPGFQDEIAFVVPGGTEAVSISVWDQQADAEAYAGSTYPQVLKAVANVVEGTPQVDTYEVSNSTFHKRLPRAWPSNAARALVGGEGGHGRPFLRRPVAVARFGRGSPATYAGR